MPREEEKPSPAGAPDPRSGVAAITRVSKTVEAAPMTKRFAKCNISHGHSPRMVKDPHTGLAVDICDTLKIEMGAELPGDFDPAKEGLEEGVHWEMGR